MAHKLRMLFCADPMDASRPDPTYEVEMAAAERIGVDCDLIRFESPVDDLDAEHAVRRVNLANAPTLGVYRGWMWRNGAMGTGASLSSATARWQASQRTPIRSRSIEH
jgi:hypothetical protein